ncbi:MAG TPA: hypothetical protein VGD78_12945 [Chthoniobacterales bacterium]
MNHILSVVAVTGLSLCLQAVAAADEIQFTTLPKTVQTTVIRETRIPDGTSVTRVTRDSGVYAVTVHGTAGPRVVYVDDSGAMVQAPAATTTTTVRAPASTTTVMQAPATTTTTTVEKPMQATEPALDSTQTMVTYDQVQGNAPRYQLLEKKGRKEVYLDRQTNQKVTVKRN